MNDHQITIVTLDKGSKIMLFKFTYRTILIALLAISWMPAWSQGSWEVMETPATQHLRSVYFTDSLYGWAVGDTGTIIHTTDGGNTWIEQDAETQNNIVNVFFLNRQQGWACSWNFEGFFGTLLLKTTDGGNTWTHLQYPEESIFMNCILFLDSLKGWMGGDTPDNPIVYTTDGGQSWEPAAVDTNNILAFFPVLNIYFYNEQYGYACGGRFDIAGVTWSTSDGGESWHPIDNTQAPADEVHGLHMFDSLNVLGAGGDPELGYGVGMLRTNDGGWNWEYEELSIAGNAFDIDFINDSEVWAPLGPAQQMIYSLDAGATWTLVPTPLATSIFDMIFPDSLHGYGVGYNGAVIRYIPKPVSVREGRQEDMLIIDIYPNPADRFLQLKIKLPETEKKKWSEAEMVITDMFGRIASQHTISADVIEGETMIYDLGHMPVGIYNCTLTLLNNGIALRASRRLVLR